MTDQPTAVPTVAGLAPTARDLGPAVPKPTALTEGVLEASGSLWEVPGIDVGYWECTPGRFAAAREGYTEVCQFLSGSVTIEVDGEEPVTFGAGDTLITPSGWRGVWDVHETVRKLYVIIDDVRSVG
ncbi:cupin domain-containing protein [Agromyces endophyticus]|uniref:cupin domain-containing protein n=1 Tax=Agromyces sp. H17E-10 TaxID=2932244 RepID=UPI001FCFE7AA|nr:cupin domain-containing protein [Agromyces sp. H17E-10]UOQ90242.1 cupin domain-containing protein [Agromyces sp. H17E-10]